ncbi:LPXTG cell wall anchor domain-containing protein [Listeria sp. FSL L7-1434]|nr:LPXTG cell wall anchor domain-containing protein [Listeria cossartiae subsp. cossartiae]
MCHNLRRIFLLLICFMILATICPYIFSTVKADSATWLEKELDYNEPFIIAVENRLNKERADITLADLESIPILHVEGASSIPDKISDFKNLTSLSVVSGTVTEVPASVAKITNLKSLNLNFNNLQVFPMVAFQLPALDSLQLGSNAIKELPSNFTSLSSHLGSLDLRNNKLIAIPTETFSINWASNYWPPLKLKPLNLSLGGNQITTDIPAGYLDDFNNGGNMLEHYDYRQGQDQLVYNGEPITVPYKTDFNQLTPDKSQLGLASGKALFDTHEFKYDDDGSSILSNGVAKTPGNGFITIKSTLSTDSNSFAKVRVPIIVEERPVGGNITVNYKSSIDETIAPADTLTGLLDDKYTSKPKKIPGYTLTKTPANANGLYTLENQTVNYVYTKNRTSKKAAILEVQYVDSNKKIISTPSTLTGTVGNSYNVKPKDIPGYQLEETPTNTNGTFGETPQKIIFVYKKTSTIESTTNPTTPNSTKNEVTNGANPISNNVKKLPNTGDKTPTKPIVAGLLVLTSSFLVWRKMSN